MTALEYDTVLRAAERHYEEASFGHAVRVAEMCAELAERYGVPVDEARVAGLLHDWARDLASTELVDEAISRGMIVADVDLQVPYLLHARVGREILAEAFPGLSPDVLDAVSSHTCGADEMGDLEKVVYVADLIEPAREFEGVDRVRTEIETADLDEAFRIAYVHSVEHLVRMRRHLHPDTVAVWNAHVAGVAD